MHTSETVQRDLHLLPFRAADERLDYTSSQPHPKSPEGTSPWLDGRALLTVAPATARRYHGFPQLRWGERELVKGEKERQEGFELKRHIPLRRVIDFFRLMEKQIGFQMISCTDVWLGVRQSDICWTLTYVMMSGPYYSLFLETVGSTFIRFNNRLNHQQYMGPYHKANWGKLSHGNRNNNVHISQTS